MIRNLLLAFVLMGTLLAAAPRPMAQTKTDPKTQPKQKPQPAIVLQPLNSQLVFEPNRGQAPANVQWLARGSGFNIALGTDGASVEYHDAVPAAAVAAPVAKTSSALLTMKVSPKRLAPKVSVVKMHLTGGSSWKAEGTNPTGGTSNYFLGKKREAWHTNIPQYAQVKVAGAYEGIDMVFHGNQSSLEYDFVVAPGADPKRIQLEFDGAANMHLDQEQGELVLTTPSGREMRHGQPKMYQQVGGKKVSVKGGYEIQKDGTAKFSVGAYNNKLPLVIDPTVQFTRFLGGSDSDQANGVTYDPNGNSYVAGVTYSNNFQVVGGIQGDQSGEDAFVTKLGPTGNILFSTYLGGDGYDIANAIAVDESGVYVTGSTGSDDFPLNQQYDGQLNGEDDAFLTKLSLLGNDLVYSTYLGGSGGESGYGIVVDANQSAYVAGLTNSNDFPLFPTGAFERYPQSDQEFVPFNGFVAKFAPAGNSLVYTTYLGGSDIDIIGAIALDSSLSAYVTGGTCSSDFPYAGYYSNANPGGCTAFATKLSPAGDSVYYSTFLGAASTYGTGISLDGAGNAYIEGTDYIGSGKTATSEVFVTKLTPVGKTVYFRLLVGGDGASVGTGIATDAAGDTYVVGSTSATNFPGEPPITPNPTAGILVKLDNDGTGPIYTFLLGAQINAVAVFKPPPRIGGLPTYATIYTAGYRYSGGTANSNQDAFVVKLSEAFGVVNEP
jgi:Beta-propeller repeat